jgi:hypothetical protein
VQGKPIGIRQNLNIHSEEPEHSSETYKHLFFRAEDDLAGKLITGTPLVLVYQALSIFTGKPEILYVGQVGAAN